MCSLLFRAIVRCESRCGGANVFDHLASLEQFDVMRSSLELRL